MVYRLGSDGIFEKPDYYRIDEDVYSKVLRDAQVPVSSLLKEKAE